MTPDDLSRTRLTFLLQISQQQMGISKQRIYVLIASKVMTREKLLINALARRVCCGGGAKNKVIK
jgi:RNase P subunit RPR2